MGKSHSACNYSGLWLRKWSLVLETFFIKFVFRKVYLTIIDKIGTKYIIGFLPLNMLQNLSNISSNSLTFICWGVLCRQAASKLKMLYYLSISSKYSKGCVSARAVWEQFMLFCLIFTSGSCFALWIFMSCSDDLAIMDQIIGLRYTVILFTLGILKQIGEGQEAAGAFSFKDRKTL